MRECRPVFCLFGDRQQNIQFLEEEIMMARLFTVLIFLLAGCATSEPVQSTKDTHLDYLSTSLEDLLEREIRRHNPGVRLYRGASGIQLRIRGSLYEPLYIVDGVPLATSPGRGLNPMEIEKIEVITELARLSYYGMRGANGVVKITTKH